MRAFSVLAASMALGACAAPTPAVPPEPEYKSVASPAGANMTPDGHALITGTVSYGTQSPPPIGAELDLSLEDVSRADAPADVISVASFTSSTPPYKFDLTYDPSVIIANHRYVVRARILVDGAVVFVSDRSYPVLGTANITHVDMLMRRAASAAPDQSTTQLENTFWKLVTLGDENVASPAGARQVHVVMHSEGHRVQGFAGCNGMMGSYTLNGARLTFSQMGGTMMACTNGMELEQKFHRMFPRVAMWKIDGETLQLLDGAETVLATFRK